ncbi:MAG: carboxypeptidase regulatory-like domain-containing protein, partial [Anaerolineales bacterium]
MGRSRLRWAAALLLVSLACNAPLTLFPSTDQPAAAATETPVDRPAATDTPSSDDGSGTRGTAFEKGPDTPIGPAIPALEITFVSEDSAVEETIATDESGSYELALDPGRYRISATHPDYDDYATAPGYWLTVGEGYRDFDLYLMRQRSADVLLITTSLLHKTADFEPAIKHYSLVLRDTEGLVATYVELDSDACLGTYGVQVYDATSWEEIRQALEAIIDATAASYVTILGGELVLPRPQVEACCLDEAVLAVPSDAWYVDFDGDQIVDEGLSVGRLPDLVYQSETVVAALQTATTLHEAGGCTLDAEVRFTLNDYTTPPYGVCDDCTKQAEFFELVSTSDYIIFAGHGGPSGFYNNSHEPIFPIAQMHSVYL